MNKHYLIIIALFLGIIVGMLQQDLIEPVFYNANNAYYYGKKGDNKISITFNVDWGQEYIPGILEVLENKKIDATFFITGNWAKKFPDLVNEIDKKGHEIGNHGYTHRHPFQLSRQGLIDLILKNEKLIENIISKKTNLFAPPYGEVNQRISEIAASIGYKTIMWSADTVDWQRPSPEIIEQRAVNKASDGGIILMHPTKSSLQALSNIIDSLENKGYHFVTVSKLLE